MKLSNDDILKEFFEELEEEYPDLTIEQVKEICHTPWRFLKKEMESGELPEVRFKYFGTFQVYTGRAKMMLKNMKVRFQKQQIDPKQYFKHKEMLEKFLDEKED